MGNWTWGLLSMPSLLALVSASQRSELRSYIPTEASCSEAWRKKKISVPFKKQLGEHEFSKVSSLTRHFCAQIFSPLDADFLLPSPQWNLLLGIRRIIISSFRPSKGRRTHVGPRSSSCGIPGRLKQRKVRRMAQAETEGNGRGYTATAGCRNTRGDVCSGINPARAPFIP